MIKLFNLFTDYHASTCVCNICTCILAGHIALVTSPQKNYYVAELCLPLSYTQQVHVVGHSKNGGLVRLDWSKPVSPTKTLIDQSYQAPENYNHRHHLTSPSSSSFLSIFSPSFSLQELKLEIYINKGFVWLRLGLTQYKDKNDETEKVLWFLFPHFCLQNYKQFHCK